MTWNISNTYSSDDMNKMQQDALRRVREMQERANKTLSEANSAGLTHPSAVPSAPHFVGGNFTNINPIEQAKAENRPIEVNFTAVPQEPHTTIVNKPGTTYNLPREAHIRNNQNQQAQNIFSFLGQGTQKGGDAISNGIESIMNLPQSLKSLPLLGEGKESITSLMDTLGISTEKIILLALIFILSNNGGDKTLILALGYLLF